MLSDEAAREESVLEQCLGNPKYSVIVPVYNAGTRLETCVGSVLGQSFKDFELLLIDDGSTDGSGGICDHYAAGDARVKAIHQANRGVSSARNAGIDAACGEIVLFVDSDDSIEEGLLSEIDSKMDSDADILFFGALKTSRGGVAVNRL